MPEEIFTEISGTETSGVTYKIDNVSFASLGVYVMKSVGMQDMPTMKEPLIIDWPDGHGLQVDLVVPRYNAREIELDCFIRAAGKLDFFNKVRTFLQSLQKPELCKLEFWMSDKPVIYMVYLADGVNIEKQWRANDMFGTFTLKLIEPSPVKRLLKRTGSVSVLSFSSENPIDIYWGDGTKDLGKFGEVSITHSYSSSGTYYILICGVIEEIEDFETDASFVWSKF
ncbi:hypothetical protein [Emticicia sp. BO119]|uniref:hypothetical protein n=1 Tax=Emticicia sp. BO119 TaxID=2757768 RepID=UPI0015F010AA|nr:hypothetical protein [Emticicia sp. BO119]MBA4852085.1 hypothetical protein [Emticicia sp. BO119]